MVLHSRQLLIKIVALFTLSYKNNIQLYMSFFGRIQLSKKTCRYACTSK